MNKFTNCFVILDALFAVGSNGPLHVKAELYYYGTGYWTTVNDYPYSSGSGLYDYDMIFIDQLSSYFVIGGSNALTTIAKFHNGAWSNAGRLNAARDVYYR